MSTTGIGPRISIVQLPRPLGESVTDQYETSIVNNDSSNPLSTQVDPQQLSLEQKLRSNESQQGTVANALLLVSCSVVNGQAIYMGANKDKAEALVSQLNTLQQEGKLLKEKLDVLRNETSDSPTLKRINTLEMNIDFEEAEQNLALSCLDFDKNLDMATIKGVQQNSDKELEEKLRKGEYRIVALVRDENSRLVGLRLIDNKRKRFNIEANVGNLNAVITVLEENLQAASGDPEIDQSSLSVRANQTLPQLRKELEELERHQQN